FNVTAWNPASNEYVDLGSGISLNGTQTGTNKCAFDDWTDLRSYGRYSNPNAPAYMPFMPCVYDTWTEQYQRDYCIYAETLDSTAAVGTTVAKIPLDGELTSAQLPDYPAPYDVELRGLQIEIRVFDPRSKAIRSATFNVDFTDL
ncbi:MAG: hypothetical protein HUK22_06155, partial [Thermoguttaceae bacterium]|nr:hypothetical protein [Thermoguttaceae bacterium]